MGQRLNHNMPRSAAKRKMQMGVSGRALGVEMTLAGWLAGWLAEWLAAPGFITMIWPSDRIIVGFHADPNDVRTPPEVLNLFS